MDVSYFYDGEPRKMDTTLLITLIVAGVIIFALLVKNLNVVAPNEAHVIAGGKKTRVYDGRGRYVFIPIMNTKNVLSKSVIEVSIPQIKLHDMNYLPFAVEISCKVQIADPRKAAETFETGSPNEIKPIVDDTIQSATRSQAMLHDLVTVMRERDTIENAIYTSTADSLARIGLKVTLFDIKNIVDLVDTRVIQDMERRRSSEIHKEARIAEAKQINEAEIYEAERQAETEIKKQEAFQRSEEARYKQEQHIADQRRELTIKEMEVLDVDTKRKQEIEKERTIIEASALAEKRTIDAGAQAEARRVQAQADADAILMKLEAEAEGTLKLAEALKALDEGGATIKIAEIYAEAQKIVSENMARGMQNNSKLFIPMGGEGTSNSLMSLIPTIEVMKEAGLNLGDLISKSDSKKKK